MHTLLSNAAYVYAWETTYRQNLASMKDTHIRTYTYTQGSTPAVDIP